MKNLEAYLSEVEKREKAATNGPWIRAGGIRPCVTTELFIPVADALGCSENAEFIAHAREDVPRLRRIVKRLQDALNLFLDHHYGGISCKAVGHDSVMKKVADALEYSGEG